MQRSGKINGIKPKVSNTTKTEKTTTKNGLSFDDAMNVLLDKIQENYDNWGGGRNHPAHAGVGQKKLDLSIQSSTSKQNLLRVNSKKHILVNITNQEISDHNEKNTPKSSHFTKKHQNDTINEKKTEKYCFFE